MKSISYFAYKPFLIAYLIIASFFTTSFACGAASSSSSTFYASDAGRAVLSGGPAAGTPSVPSSSPTPFLGTPSQPQAASQPVHLSHHSADYLRRQLERQLESEHKERLMTHTKISKKRRDRVVANQRLFEAIYKMGSLTRTRSEMNRDAFAIRQHLPTINSFSIKRTLLMRLPSTPESFTIQCAHPGCPETFNNTGSMERHFKKHTDSGTKCPLGCTRYYPGFYCGTHALITHVAKHLGILPPYAPDSY